MRLRVMYQTDVSGEKEYIHFTDDFDASADDYIYPGCSVDADEIIEVDVQNSMLRMALESDNTWRRQ